MSLEGHEMAYMENNERNLRPDGEYVKRNTEITVE
jgi:hypothetical protein